MAKASKVRVAAPSGASAPPDAKMEPDRRTVLLVVRDFVRTPLEAWQRGELLPQGVQRWSTYRRLHQAGFLMPVEVERDAEEAAIRAALEATKEPASSALGSRKVGLFNRALRYRNQRARGLKPITIARVWA